MNTGDKCKLDLPQEIYIDFTDDRDHMHAHESIDLCRSTALVGKYVLIDTILPQRREISKA